MPPAPSGARISYGPRRVPATSSISLLPGPLEAVRELRTAIALVRELPDQERERFDVTSDPERSGIHWIESHIANQPGGYFLGAVIVPAVDQRGPSAPAPCFEDGEQHLARHGAESGCDLCPAYLLCKRLRP